MVSEESFNSCRLGDFRSFKKVKICSNKHFFIYVFRSWPARSQFERKNSPWNSRKSAQAPSDSNLSQIRTTFSSVSILELKNDIRFSKIKKKIKNFQLLNFILATSEGNLENLDQKAGGVCASHSMKMRIAVHRGGKILFWKQQKISLTALFFLLIFCFSKIEKLSNHNFQTKLASSESLKLKSTASKTPSRPNQVNFWEFL